MYLWMQYLPLGIQTATFVVSAVALFMALRTYRFNGRTKRSDFIYKLHTDFFVSETYKTVRRILDCTNDEERAAAIVYVAEEPEALTDYLNLFEMVAYLWRTRQLTDGDVKALFGYYLTCLKKNAAITSYLGVEESSFENLSHMLRKLE